MSSASPHLQRSASPTAVLRSGVTPGYRAASGEFNFYPTSAHKRSPSMKFEVSDGDSPSIQLQAGVLDVAPSSRCVVRPSATSPSSSGLSRSPSQPNTAANAGAPRAASMPLSDTAAKRGKDARSATAAGGFARGGAPLLHRYRTSQMGQQQQRAPPRSASASPSSSSSPAAQAARLPLAAVDSNTAKSSTPFMRRSLLTTAKLAKPHSRVETFSSPTDAAAAAESLTADKTTFKTKQTGAQPIQDARQVSEAGRKSTRAESAPVMRVRLTETGDEVAPAASPQKQRNECATSCSQSTANQSHLSSAPKAQIVKALTGAVEERGDSSATLRASVEESVAAPTSPSATYPSSVSALLSKKGSSSTCCPDGPCMHSEQSIGEFILMQRELRRCYAAMEDYELVVAQLRQECKDAWAAHHHLQGLLSEREEEIAMQMQAAQEVRQGSASALVNGKEPAPASASEDEDGDDEDLKACLETTRREVLEELQHALRAEEAAHAATRQLLEEAEASRAQWEAHAAKLEALRGIDRERLGCSTSRSVAAVHGVETPSSPEKVVQDLPAQVSACTSPQHPHRQAEHSDVASPAPRVQSPPHPHEPAVPRRRAEAAGQGSGNVEMSAISATTEGSAVNNAEDDAREESSCSSASCQTGAVEAVGSGAVRVEEPQRRQLLGSEEEQSSRRNIRPPQEQSTNLLAGPVADASCEVVPAEVNTSVADGHHVLQQPIDAQKVRSPRTAASALRLAPLPWETEHFSQASAEPPAFPLPSFARATPISITPLKPTPSRAAAEASTVATASEAVMAQRKCKELLNALLDKERQLAVLAEERTKYKLLYEEQQQQRNAL